MKVGNLVNGLAVIDVKRVNKLNLIQFLKEVDNYLQQGYKLDVQSGRQVGLVLSVDVYKAEEGVEPERETESTKVEQPPLEEPKVGVVEDITVESVVELTEQPKENVAVEPVEEVVKKPTPRAKKTT